MITARFTAVLAALVAVIVLGTTSPAAAQAQVPTFELSAGYQFTHIPDQSFPLGFAIDAARNWGNLGLVAEGGWAHDSESDDEFDVDESFNLWHLAAGARVSARQNPRVTPFAQVLAGWLQARASVEVAGVDISDSTNHFMLQPGGGVSFEAGDGWAIVGSVDYRRVFISDEDDDDGSGENQFRVFFGARMLLD
jgi:opacity protein-like surface antigen